MVGFHPVKVRIEAVPAARPVTVCVEVYLVNVLVGSFTVTVTSKVAAAAEVL